MAKPAWLAFMGWFNKQFWLGALAGIAASFLLSKFGLI